MSLFLENKVGLFFGSDTGNTEEVTKDIVEAWKISALEVIEAHQMTVADYARFEIIILGLSTWYDGELQSNFEEFFKAFKTIDFSGKIIAMYGLGDQLGYAEYFVDGLGILGEVIIENGGHIIGMWSTDGYEFEASKGRYNEGYFYGLALDNDNELEMTSGRIKAWIDQLEQELTEIIEASMAQ